VQQPTLGIPTKTIDSQARCLLWLDLSIRSRTTEATSWNKGGPHCDVVNRNPSLPCIIQQSHHAAFDHWLQLTKMFDKLGINTSSYRSNTRRRHRSSNLSFPVQLDLRFKRVEHAGLQSLWLRPRWIEASQAIVSHPYKVVIATIKVYRSCQ
jgi:hypothetical protein